MAQPIRRAPRVFISYSHDSPSHADHVLRLSDRLRADGVDADVDHYAPAPSQGWPRWMEREIREADFVLAICTETYRRRVENREGQATGRGVRWEGMLISQHIYDSDTTNSKFLPVLLGDAKDEDIPVPLRGATHYRVDDDLGYEALYRRLTGQPLIEKPELGQLRSLPPKTRNPSFSGLPWNVPFERNVFFTGRKELLRTLHERLVPPPKTVEPQCVGVCGLGGCGKTQVVVEFAYRYRDVFRAVLWLRGGSEDEVRESLREAAAELQINEGDENRDFEIVRTGLIDWFRSNADWLLVVDGADHPSQIASYLPRQGKGSVIVTSRCPNLDMLGCRDPITTETLSPTESADFLVRRTSRHDSDPVEQEAIHSLAQELGHLPLALEQAGAYVAAKMARFRDYLTSYRSRRLELLERATPVAGGYFASVATTWSLNFEEVALASSASADILYLLAFLAPDDIPLELFAHGRSELSESLRFALADVAEDPILIDELLEPMVRFSLVRRNLRSMTISVHQLVQDVIRDSMDWEA